MVGYTTTLENHMTMFKIALGALAMTALQATAHPPEAARAQGAFFAQLGKLCGATYEGASVFPRDPADSFAGKKLVAHIAACKPEEIRIPFLVGEDRSRTWIIRNERTGLTLKHDHRHADGTPDAVTMYGGLASDGGTTLAQSFLADAHTAELIPAASTNVWTLSLSADASTMTYYLERDGKPRFKAELRRVANAK
ncbi:hypothetical protein C7C56_004015 [Massilia glaciei]|uniref:Uncharacterized protein n=2 Tax=Massilia glaciei TaxID=1524097 RepID=A0A2U2I5L7_9BURK|nr:hypothetical protein C7C56_004015 [Massilia glaciei]